MTQPTVNVPPVQKAATQRAASGHSLLEPRALAKISRMDLIAKTVMDGYVQGMHKSPHIGFALDFAQHRQYVPGDDVKRIDWRVYAKADRYYIKQYEVTTNLRCYIVLDASGSMKYQGGNSLLTKFRYSQFIAACIAYLVLHQQDSVGLITLDHQIREFIPPKSATSHLLTITNALDATQIGGESDLSSLLHTVAERAAPRSMLVVISDFFDNADQLVEALHHFRHKRHEVILLQVMADDELTFPFRKFSEFSSLETRNQRVKMDPASTRAIYLANVAAHIKKLRDNANALRMSHELLNTKDPFDDALTHYLAMRMGSR
jgi:uncharacterized protein (DUF58 family)